MPFAREGQVEIVNDGKASRNVTFEISHAPLTRPIAQLGRFHAKWHRDAFLPSEPERRIDWPMLKTEGAGRFVGVMLHVWNPKGGWWGEGDEKFFVDGEKFPSTFGTGSEDYFGYAWGNPTLFARPYHAQTMTQNNKGHQVRVACVSGDGNLPRARAMHLAIWKWEYEHGVLPCDRFMIVGDAHAPQSIRGTKDRLSDVLNQQGRPFLPLTNVTVYSLGMKRLWRGDFLVVNSYGIILKNLML
jgi:hypothetical protein